MSTPPLDPGAEMLAAMEAGDFDRFVDALAAAGARFGLSDKQVTEIGEFLATGEPWRNIARSFGWEEETLRRHYTRRVQAAQEAARAPIAPSGNVIAFEDAVREANEINRREAIQGILRRQD